MEQLLKVNLKMKYQKNFIKRIPLGAMTHSTESCFKLSDSDIFGNQKAQYVSKFRENEKPVMLQKHDISIGFTKYLNVKANKARLDEEFDNNKPKDKEKDKDKDK